MPPLPLPPLITPRSILIPGKAITERLLPINIPASSSSSSNNNKQTRNVGERNDHNLRRCGANRYICFGYRTARKNTEIYCFSRKSHSPSLFNRIVYVLVCLCLWCSNARVNDLHYIAIAAAVVSFKRWDVRRSFGCCCCCSGSQEILCGLRIELNTTTTNVVTTCSVSTQNFGWRRNALIVVVNWVLLWDVRCKHELKRFCRLLFRGFACWAAASLELRNKQELCRRGLVYDRGGRWKIPLGLIRFYCRGLRSQTCWNFFIIWRNKSIMANK